MAFLGYQKHQTFSHITGSAYLNATLVRYGLLSSNPMVPSVGIAIPTLEMYRRLRLRSPHVSVQAWVRVLCDLHNMSILHNKYTISLTLCPG
jgi:hypothetical protein